MEKGIFHMAKVRGLTKKNSASDIEIIEDLTFKRVNKGGILFCEIVSKSYLNGSIKTIDFDLGTLKQAISTLFSEEEYSNVA